MDIGTIITTALVSGVVSIAVTGLTHYLGKNKTQAEIQELKANTTKTETEIEGLKRSFQPTVIATLQSVQDKVIDKKIEALSKIIQLKADLMAVDISYDDEGEPIIRDIDDYYNEMFKTFRSVYLEDYKNIHNTYSYLFPDKVLDVLQNLMNSLTDLDKKVSYYFMATEGFDPPHPKDVKQLETVIDLFSESLMAIRKDCHLDSSFIHDFIEQNKNL